VLLRGLGDLDLSDDSVTMGDDIDTDVDSLSDLATAQNTADSRALDSSVMPGQSTSTPDSGFSLSSILGGAGSVLKSIFGGSTSSSSSGTAAQLAAANAAAQAASTRNMLLVGGLAAAGIVGVLVLRRRKAS
jgi:hypothetical protein